MVAIKLFGLLCILKGIFEALINNFITASFLFVVIFTLYCNMYLPFSDRLIKMSLGFNLSTKKEDVSTRLKTQ